MLVHSRQHDLGLGGLALLRNRLVGDEKLAKEVIDEMCSIAASIKSDGSVKSEEATNYSVTSGYEKWAETYDGLPNLLIEIEEPVVKPLLKSLSNGITLDAGCGTGRYSSYLQSIGHKVTGVDLSKEMLLQAKGRNNNVNYIQGDLTKLPLESGSFDLVICSLALTHFQRLGQVVSELSRVVRKGGTVIISDIHPWLVEIGGQAEFRDKDGKLGYVTNYVHWHSEYISEFRKHNLNIVSCLEPVLKAKHVKLANQGFNLNSKTVAAALQGLPIALIWVLNKN
jgi:ubiquinone/menaquinone biosynthesis C-methylase UbiE